MDVHHGMIYKDATAKSRKMNNSGINN